MVLGNNDSQYIEMHWGNSLSSARGSLSSSVTVFDTTLAASQGVWHLSGPGNATAFDATVNGYHGTPYNMTSASAVAGAIGNTRDFNGTTGYITMPKRSGKLDMPQKRSVLDLPVGLRGYRGFDLARNRRQGTRTILSQVEMFR